MYASFQWRFATHPPILPCIDINECLEELDNCTKAEQVCLNTRGAFKCQMIPKEDCFTGFTFDNLTKSCQGCSKFDSMITRLNMIWQTCVVVLTVFELTILNINYLSRVVLFIKFINSTHISAIP